MIPLLGYKAFYRNTYIGIVFKVEVLDIKYKRDCSHLITIKTAIDTLPVIGKRIEKDFDDTTYNFKP